MAELLILVVIAGVLVLYAVDRARKLRARARQMSAMNERLDVAAAKVDEQRERKQARVRASAELTSVLPAIKRPPLTLPGVPGPAPGPAEEPAAPEPEAGPAAPAADAGNTPDGAGAHQNPAAQAAADAAGSPAAAEGSAAGDDPAGDSPDTAAEVPPEPVRTPEGTLTMGRVIPEAQPGPRPQVTSDGTLIMPAVPGPAAGTALPPAPSPARPRTGASPGRASPGRASLGRPSLGLGSPASPAPGSPAKHVLSSLVLSSRAQGRSRPTGTSYTCAGNFVGLPPRRMLASD